MRSCLRWVSLSSLLALSGCAWFDAAVAIESPPSAVSATVALNGSAQITTTSGGIAIVEQAPGQGFVVEGPPRVAGQDTLLAASAQASLLIPASPVVAVAAPPATE